VNETYLSIGPASTPLIAVMGIACIAVVLIAFAITKRKSRAFGSMIALGSWYVVAGLLGLPVAFMFTVTFLIIPAFGVFTKQPQTPRFLVPIFAIVMLAIGGFMFWMLSENRITLSAQQFQSEPTGMTRASGFDFDKSDFARKGLRVDASSFHNDGWLMGGRHFGWSIWSGDRPGPYFSGRDYYWGPNGLIRGDSLGKRIADWAGSKPVYKVY
jgi:hypothetical protein